MDASSLTKYIKNRNEYGYYFYNNSQPQQLSISNLREGQQAYFYSKRLTILPCACSPCTLQISEPNCSVIDSTATGLSSLFSWISVNNKGPTITARYIYLFFFTIVAAYNWLMRPTNAVFSGIIDGWNWDETVSMSQSPSPQETYVWLNHAISDLAPQLFTGPGIAADFSQVLTMERNLFNWTTEQQATAIAKIREKGNWALFLTRWNTWASARFEDGNRTLPSPTDTNIVNIGTEIKVWSFDLPSFVDSAKWTPLRISPTSQSKQSYLTFFWDSVVSTGITSDQENILDTFSDNFFPKPNERISELQEVIDITANLTDNQKVQAEFWAGGPHTITPPGMMAWFWRDFVLSQSSTIGPTKALFSGLDLAVHLFEGSRLTWRQKARHCQSRPIQDIRIGWAGQQLSLWNGSKVPAELWVPYQESTFVTPPFADFPSGHSHFSQAFALVMTSWFGQDIPTTQVNRDDMTFISAIYSGAPQQIGAYNTIIFPAGASAIQPSQVPAQAVELVWKTWQDLANSAGFSRLYGGIHCMSAHTSSQAIARELDTVIQGVWTRK
jgi:hypothetical protein